MRDAPPSMVTVAGLSSMLLLRLPYLTSAASVTRQNVLLDISQRIAPAIDADGSEAAAITWLAARNQTNESDVNSITSRASIYHHTNRSHSTGEDDDSFIMHNPVVLLVALQLVVCVCGVVVIIMGAR